ncbi:PP2C family protein-serine/threonine phosphatase [Clostridium sp. BJN0001]|uniref:PP2C family protein-serine/threonine phosphatase n=1 Tax=Clostridium sp. BJN0001 TaxID=2930219 RepID=UPI001FD2B3B3|nr:PP2C family protein-serine/threonine phosphatase [Clostridium sp. BJN0001]
MNYSLILKKEEIKRIFFSAFIVFIFSIIGLYIKNFFSSIIDFRAYEVITPVLGLYFGPSGAIGSSIAGLIFDYIYSDGNILLILSKFILNFFYAYTPYKLWYTFTKNEECRIPNLNDTHSIIKFGYILFVGSLAYRISQNSIYSLSTNEKSIDIKILFLQFLNNYNFEVIVGALILMFLSLTLIRPHVPSRHTKIKKNINYQYIFYLLFIVGIAGIVINKFNIYNNVLNIGIVILTYLLILIFLLCPISNGKNIINIEQAKGIRSIHGKVTLTFLFLGIIVIVIMDIISNIALYSCRNINTYVKVYAVIGVFSSLVIFFIIEVIKFVEKRITKPIKILFDIVADFVQNRREYTDEDMNYLREKCFSINTGDEIEQLAIEFNRMMNEIRNNINELEKVTASIQKEATELEVAKKIQTSALPGVFQKKDRFELYANISPALKVSGDFYDYFLINENELIFLVADVSGKGIPAALFMMKAKSTVKNSFSLNKSLSDITEKINNELSKNNKMSMFVTAFIAKINLETGVMTYVNAGHTPPLLKKKDMGYDFLNVETNCILAIMPDKKYEEQKIQLKKNDTLFIYTDGITEAIDINGDLYGANRLKEFFNSSIGEKMSNQNIANKVREDVSKFSKGQKQKDDMTMLIFKYLG